MNKILKNLLHLLIPVLILSGFLLMFKTEVYANEGKIDLRTSSVSCQGISVWQSDRYMVIGRCQGLVYPYQERLDTYIMWLKAEDDGTMINGGSINKGFFEAQTDKRFTEVLITAEESSSPREPGNSVIVRGGLQPIGFNAIAAPTLEQQENPAHEEKASPAVTPTPTVTREVKSSNPFNLKQSPSVVIIIISVIVIIVLGIISFVRR